MRREKNALRGLLWLAAPIIAGAILWVVAFAATLLTFGPFALR